MSSGKKSHQSSYSRSLFIFILSLKGIEMSILRHALGKKITLLKTNSALALTSDICTLERITGV